MLVIYNCLSNFQIIMFELAMKEAMICLCLLLTILYMMFNFFFMVCFVFDFGSLMKFQIKVCGIRSMHSYHWSDIYLTHIIFNALDIFALIIKLTTHGEKKNIHFEMNYNIKQKKPVIQSNGTMSTAFLMISSNYIFQWLLLFF